MFFMELKFILILINECAILIEAWQVRDGQLPSPPSAHFTSFILGATKDGNVKIWFEMLIFLNLTQSKTFVLGNDVGNSGRIPCWTIRSLLFPADV